MFKCKFSYLPFYFSICCISFPLRSCSRIGFDSYLFASAKAWNRHWLSYRWSYGRAWVGHRTLSYWCNYFRSSCLLFWDFSSWLHQLRRLVQSVILQFWPCRMISFELYASASCWWFCQARTHLLQSQRSLTSCQPWQWLRFQRSLNIHSLISSLQSGLLAFSSLRTLLFPCY